MRYLAVLIVCILLACSDSFVLGKIDYADDELTVQEVLKHEEFLYEEKKYEDLREAYRWIKVRSPEYYEKNIKQKDIDLYGLEGRYEKQLLEYIDIFPHDSVDAVDKVPNFFYQMGKSAEDRSKLPQGDHLDSALVHTAIGFFKKSYTYELHVDKEIQSLAMFYAAINSARIGRFDEAYRIYTWLAQKEEFVGTLGQMKGYYRIDNVRDTEDIEITSDMVEVYNQRIAQTLVKKDSLQQSIELKINESGMIASDSTKAVQNTDDN